MAIDLYLEWDGKKGYTPTLGRLDYIRECIHGGPYASKIFVPEAFEKRGERVIIPNTALVSRIGETIYAALIREVRVYEGVITANDISKSAGLTAQEAFTKLTHMELAKPSLVRVGETLAWCVLMALQNWSDESLDREPPPIPYCAARFMNFSLLHNEMEQEGKNPTIRATF